ncbi:PREDICTED: histone H1oo, partial [Merops nubicus]|uniref:histone H1oo n=1 Tax=Merops nubicus TaxID=57421 RepID=UPI0004F00042
SEAAGASQLPGLLARRYHRPHPPTLTMVIEAVRAQDQKKGVSVIAIKRFILGKYPSVNPIHLKYLLKQALSKGLSRGDLVRPRNSSATGATGRFKLAPKKLQQKPLPGQADPDRGQALQPAQKRTTKLPKAPAEGGQQRGAKEEKLTAVKKPKAKLVDALPPAAVKPGSNGAKPPRAATQPRAPGKGRLGPPAAPADEDAGGGPGDNPAGAGVKGPRKVPVAKSKGKAPKGAQQDPPKAKQGQGKVGKPQVTPGAGQRKVKQQKADTGVGKKAP